jgi:hypothetical protein
MHDMGDRRHSHGRDKSWKGKYFAHAGSLSVSGRGKGSIFLGLTARN